MTSSNMWLIGVSEGNGEEERGNTEEMFGFSDISLEFMKSPEAS